MGMQVQYYRLHADAFAVVRLDHEFASDSMIRKSVRQCPFVYIQGHFTPASAAGSGSMNRRVLVTSERMFGSVSRSLRRVVYQSALKYATRQQKFGELKLGLVAGPRRRRGLTKGNPSCEVSESMSGQRSCAFALVPHVLLSTGQGEDKADETWNQAGLA